MLQLTLGRNNALKALEHSPEEVWKIMFTRHAMAKTEEDREAIKAWAPTISKASSRDFTKLFTKGSDIAGLMGELYTCKPFRENLELSLPLILKLLAGVWGAFEAIVKPSWDLLRFIASPTPLPTTSPNVPLTTWDLHVHIDNHKANFEPDTFLLEYLVSLSSARFHHSLTKVFNHFGTQSPVWTNAYREYMDQVQKQLATIYERKRGELTPEACATWILAQKKLDILYGRSGLAFGPGLVPALEGRLPILCPRFFAKLLEISMEMEFPFHLVSSTFWSR
jgi:hypothetical protein